MINKVSSLIPEGWSVKSIADLVTLQYGKSPREIFNEDGQYPVIGTGGVTGTTSSYLHEGGTTVIGRKGTINKPSYIEGRFWAIDTTYYGENYQDVDPKWFYYSLNSFDLMRHNEASGVPSLSRDTLYAIQLLKPPLPEQQKIATILSSVDDVIEKTRTQIDKLKDLKTGMMQELLTKGIGHTEFKDSPVGRIPAAWEVFTMQEVLHTVIDYRGKSPPKSEQGIPLITAKNIRQGYIDPEPREYIGEDQYSSWMVRGLPAVGDVFITTEAPLGNVALVPKYKFAIGQRVLTLSPSETITTKYLFYTMQSRYFREQLLFESTGSTVTGIKQSTFRNILIPVPSRVEQQKIAKPLNALNHRIDTALTKLGSMEAMKKALMQDLLTGKVRVKPNKSAAIENG